MITPGKLLLLLLAAASVCVDFALAANIYAPDPSQTMLGCLLGLILGQIGLVASGWVKRPENWAWWSLALLGAVAGGSVLLGSMGKVPLLHWTIILAVFASLSVSLPMIYRIGHGQAKSQFSLSAIFALMTASTLVCFAVVHIDFPWEELPVALPGLMVWSCPAMVMGLTLVEQKTDPRRQLAIGLGAILAMSLTAAWLLPSMWNRLPVVIAWESIYLIIAGMVVLQARANDTEAISTKTSILEG
ncbi:hypothetical protein [Blastopirellula marina]|uniref:Uncharacterized protein n=1 Tax=Blastopirellula marina TaxID=124 RepID=A0A2S8FWR7_9BACT|nr:hypothetical protein [Blastopirellula marina]PQO36618.1 hypothetical protein C5Y98_11520 [Blastopirellula marina]PTL44448.1 hypothetical protein C5Y97_11530 [Blastopirellula marina]